MFTYCHNNPICNYDPSGEFAISLTVLGLVIGVAAGAIIGGAVTHNVAEDSGAEGWELAGWTALGVLGGGLIGGAFGAGCGALTTQLTGIIGLSVTKYSIIPVRGITLLGNMPAYLTEAASIGAGFYHISDELYESLSVIDRLGNNMQYIKDAAALGSQFILSPDWVTKVGSTLWYEICCLVEDAIAWIMY